MFYCLFSDNKLSNCLEHNSELKLRKRKQTKIGKDVRIVRVHEIFGIEFQETKVELK